MNRRNFLAFSGATVLLAGCHSRTTPHNHHNGHHHEKGKVKNFRTVPKSKAEILQSGKEKDFCTVCGMTLHLFYRTNHAADIGGETHQYCSHHCMLEEKKVTGKPHTNIKVVDNVTLKFMDARKAYYVYDSLQPGTMSPISKYAFSNKSAAMNFIEVNEGELKTFDEVYKLGIKNLDKEISMIKKKQAKAAKMGKKIYEKMCKPTEERFSSPALAKSYLQENNLCGNLKGKKFQQVGLYLSGR
ncbi:MAG: nitrous oxide reductase accessory protein NosL [Campylobacterales bacterium]|nr:nitrous oxide reductase accessory protein NosL [Campylobacterales bacterium]